MKMKHGVVGVVASVVLAFPLSGMADPGKDESGHGNCFEHKGKVHCKGGGKYKQKRKYKSEYEYESEGEYRHTAGGPPPWAPAHGWRRKHGDGGYRDEYEPPVVMERGGTRVMVSHGTATVDVGIDNGTCNRDAIGTVAGGVIGGVIGHRVGDKNQREVTTVLGVVLGGLVGREIGRSMDKADQNCTGQVLEQASDNQTVRWADSHGRGEYSVTPLRTYETEGHNCRDYLTEYQGSGDKRREQATACRNADGTWRRYNM